MRRILFLALILFAAIPAWSATFVVTSTADSGPGTLRQALTDAAANSTAAQDIIAFNIADLSEAGRTITLLSELPACSSNLVIDGTTQPGLKFGVSDAKVKIVVLPTLVISQILKIFLVDHCEIYGLSLVGAYAEQGYSSLSAAGINVSAGSFLTIGKPGKGNVITNCYSGIAINATTDVVIQSNISGLKSDGLTPHRNYIGMTCTGITNLTIGGVQQIEGNIVSNYGQTQITVAGCNHIIIAFNLLGTDYTGNAVIGATFIGTAYSAYAVQASTGTDLTIYKNVFAGLGEAIFLYKFGGNYAIDNNRIGVGLTGNANFGNRQAIDIIECSQFGLISNNIIANNEYGVAILGSGAVKISKNSFSCNSKSGIVINNSTAAIPSINITAKTATAVAGTTTAGSTIELFYADECNLCQGKTFIAAVQADNDGNWTYTGAITGAVVGTAKGINGATSPFSTPEIISGNTPVVKNATCNSNDGAITGLTYRNATVYNWMDINGIIVGNDKDLIGAPAGKYRVSVDNGSCSAVSQYYEIKSNPIAINTGAIKFTFACNGANGAITGAVIPAGASAQWVNSAGAVAGTNADLVNVPAGKYKLIANQGTCSAETPYYEVFNSFDIDPAGIIKNNVTCAGSDGSIKGLTVINHTKDVLTYNWKDAGGVIRGTSPDLINIPAGAYTFTVTSADNSCSQTYGPVTIVNNIALKIDESGMATTPANCGRSNGSITNITVKGTGTIKYTWKTALNQFITNNKDLIGRPASAYILEVTDDGPCGPVYSSIITIPEESGIKIDDSKIEINKATCQYDNGSIKGITVTGATKYEWFNGDNKSVSTDLILTGMPVNNYYLVASNDLGCLLKTGFYPIAREAPPITVGITPTLKNAACGLNNGSIAFAFKSAPAITPKSYRWVNHATGTTITTTGTQGLSNLDAGTYDIYYRTDDSGCERFLINYTIGRDPGLDVVTTTVKVTDDVCEGGTGSITGIGATGMSPLTYTWTDDAGALISNEFNLTHAKAGDYHLKITDGAGCFQDLSYTIKNTRINLNAPAAAPVALCAAGDAFITLPTAPAGYGFRLYDNLTDTQPIDTNHTGKFKIKATKSRSYFVSQYLGNCETARAEVKVTVGVSAVSLSNAFSPNGDGINDTWKIPGAENYPNALVQIFNRAGDKVYHSIGYATPFDGFYKGKPLPAGTYYYIINLNAGCSLLSGNLTIIR